MFEQMESHAACDRDALIRVRWDRLPIGIANEARSVRWLDGKCYAFTAAQARVFLRLLAAWVRGIPDVHYLQAIAETGVETDGFVALFRIGSGKARCAHPAIGRVIVRGAGRGMYRLAKSCPAVVKDAALSEMERMSPNCHKTVSGPTGQLAYPGQRRA